MQRVIVEVFTQASDTDELRCFIATGPGAPALKSQSPLKAAELQAVLSAHPLSAAHPHHPIKLGRALQDWLDSHAGRHVSTTLATVSASPATLGRGVTVMIDVQIGGEHDAHWELLADGSSFLAARAVPFFTPVRYVRRDASLATGELAPFPPPPPANRPLRLLFMASSPEGVQPVLAFEREESLILDIARGPHIDLVVEESGSVAGLKERVRAAGDAGFDAVHLSGHADIRDGIPVFIAESDVGLPSLVTAEQLSDAFGGVWPRLVFLSGCHTAGQPAGTLPSMCEALVRAGAPAVVGWAEPVLDRTASVAAAALYDALSVGRPIDEAVAMARRAMIEAECPDWYLLRVYSDITPLSALVTAPDTAGRERIRVTPAAREFLDAGSKKEVCPPDRFVGRRRVLQRCLRTLRAGEGAASYAEGVLLSGMGGLGKSSLAARLCDRLGEHARLVCVGTLDEVALLRGIGDCLADAPAAVASVNEPGQSLRTRLMKLLSEHLATRDVLFIFDDFEQNACMSDGRVPLLDAAGRMQLVPSAGKVLEDLLWAIRKTSSRSRVIVTCRYQFQLGGPATLHAEPLDSVRGADWQKKLDQLPVFAAGSSVALDLRTRAAEAAQGNHRLLERLSAILAQPQLDSEALIARVEASAAAFREEVLLNGLLQLLAPHAQRSLAFLSLFGIPVEIQAVSAAAADAPDVIQADLSRGVALGLVEVVADPRSGASLFITPGLVDPLLGPRLDELERSQALSRACRYVYESWWKRKQATSELHVLEVHRLAVLAGERDIAVEIAGAVAGVWNRSHRYREALIFCRSTLEVGEDARLLRTTAQAEILLGETASARVHLERALSLAPPEDRQGRSHVIDVLAGLVFSLGDVPGALTYWEEALTIDRALNNPQNEAATLHNMAGAVAQQGDVGRAMQLWQESLSILEQVGDVRGKAATLHEMAGVVAQQGDVGRAMRLWQESLTIKEQIGDHQGKAATLNNMAGVVAQQGEVGRAMQLWQESLSIKEQIGDVKGKAATLNNMASVVAQQGDIGRAMQLWQESLSIKEQIGDVQGKAATLHNMASVVAQQGDIGRAMQLWQESLSIQEQIGDVKGKAATLHEMAGVVAQQGDIGRAMQLWQESLSIKEQIGDVQGKAATLSNMAGVVAQQGDIGRAMQLWQESLSILEQIGDVQGKAATLHNMAGVVAQQGDIGRAMQLWQESLSIKEQIGNVRGKAATLHEMAGVVAQQGDIGRAMQLWQESLTILEQIGDVRGKSATLANMAWAAGKSGDSERETSLNVQAAAALAAVHAFGDLVTVLGNLGSDEATGTPYLSQALWLAMRIEVPLNVAINLSGALIMRVTPTSPAGPLIAAAAALLTQTRQAPDSMREEMQQYAGGMLGACAEARGVPPEKFGEWFVSQELNDPAVFLPKLNIVLEDLVGTTAWLFDRTVFGPGSRPQR